MSNRAYIIICIRILVLLMSGSDLIVLGQSPRHNICLSQYTYYIEYHY